MTPRDGRIRVLHVDDDPECGELVATFLEREESRIEVTTTTNVGDGLDRLATRRIDCVVSDYELPGRDGIDLLRLVREDHPDLPFILFTGRGSESVASEAISAGVTDYLQKAHDADQYTILANRIVNAVERWRAEREADRTLTRLEAITENSSDAILTIDTDSTVRFANPAVELLTGYEPRELVGESLTTLLPEPYHDQHLAGVERYLETGERSLDWDGVEFPLQHRDGHEVPVSIAFGEFVDGGDRRFVGILRDVSNRVRMEEALREREERFRQMAENIQEVVWMSDPAYEVIFYINPAYAEVWGEPVEALYDDPESFLDAVHPEDRERVEAALAEQARGTYDEEYRIIRPDGELRWIHARSVPVRDDDGEVYRLVGIALDITARKEREREYERVLDLLDKTEEIADVGGWEIDPATEEVFWSDHLFEMLGVTYEEAPPLEAALDVYVEADRPKVEAAVEAAMAEGEAFDVEARFERADGEIRWFRIMGEPVIDEGKVQRLRGAVQDVTEHKRRESRLEEFASVVSHDLRNPLEVARGNLRLLREECDSEYVEPIASAHDRMDTLIEDLLAVARDGDVVHRRERIDLETAVTACWDTVASGDTSLEVVSTTTIEADRSRLKQLIENLLRNAVEHGGASVTVGTLEDGFFVEDDGDGFPGDTTDIFEMGVSTKSEGTGFGLAIARQIADAHGWSLRATESAAGGARFEIHDV